jgi:hypothetical protein
MKLISSALLMAAALLAGCAFAGNQVVLAPVGPPPFESKAAGLNGSLVVFSAFDPNAHFNSLPYRMFYTDYRIFSEDGRLLPKVENDNGTSLEGPKTVTLPAGSYRVVARASGYGTVTVPVIIAADRTTTVHLEGGGAWQNEAAMAHANAVRLPDGRIAGWRAEPESTFQASAAVSNLGQHGTASEFSGK